MIKSLMQTPGTVVVVSPTLYNRVMYQHSNRYYEVISSNDNNTRVRLIGPRNEKNTFQWKDSGLRVSRVSTKRFLEASELCPVFTLMNRSTRVVKSILHRAKWKLLVLSGQKYGTTQVLPNPRELAPVKYDCSGNPIEETND